MPFVCLLVFRSSPEQSADQLQHFLLDTFCFQAPVSAQLLDSSDPMYAWRSRMFDLYGGLARKAAGYHDYDPKGKL